MVANTSSISAVVFDCLAGIAISYASYDAIEKIAHSCLRNSTSGDPLQASKSLAFLGGIGSATGWAIGTEAGILVGIACAAVGIAIRECVSVPEVTAPILEAVQTSSSSSSNE